MNIFVSNLTSNVTEDQLKDAFREYGKTKSVKIVKDMFSGESKGFAFVEMYSENEGQKAIDGLNLFELDGKMISVSKARPERNKRGARKSGGSRKGR